MCTYPEKGSFGVYFPKRRPKIDAEVSQIDNMMIDKTAMSNVLAQTETSARLSFKDSNLQCEKSKAAHLEDRKSNRSRLQRGNKSFHSLDASLIPS